MCPIELGILIFNFLVHIFDIIKVWVLYSKLFPGELFNNVWDM